jgi:hypothetical protein
MIIELYLKPEQLEFRLKALENGEEAMFYSLKDNDLSGYITIHFPVKDYSFKSGLGAYILVKKR